MLRLVYRNAPRNMPTAEGPGSGPQGRINKLRRLVTDLLRHERIEDKAFYLDESRGYVELIVQEAHKYGDKHKPTMEMLDHWILEKDLIHKLFKEIVPRYTNYDTCITKLYQLPTVYPGKGAKLGVLELKGNSLPSIEPRAPDLSKTLLNVLLNNARKEKLSSIRLKNNNMNKNTENITENVK